MQLADVLPEHFANHKAWAELFTTLLAAVTALCGAVAVVFKPFRVFLRKKLESMWVRVKDFGAIFAVPREMRKHIRMVAEEREAKAAAEERTFQALTRLEATITGLAADVTEVRQKLNNGISSHLKSIAAMTRHTFQEAAVPQFICNRNGENLNISYAYRRLMGTTAEGDLLGLNWKLFARKDPNGYDRYWRGFLDAAAVSSNYSGTLQLWAYNHRGELEAIGEWDINLTIVADHGTNIGGDMEAFYIGRLVPFNDEAKAHYGKTLRRLDPDRVPH